MRIIEKLRYWLDKNKYVWVKAIIKGIEYNIRDMTLSEHLILENCKSDNERLATMQGVVKQCVLEFKCITNSKFHRVVGFATIYDAF